MKELVVVSGKGGTGKTSIVASLAALAGGNAVCADCDVDAADLHLVLSPRIQEKHEFYGLDMARINPEKCTACGECAEHCRFDAIFSPVSGNESYSVDPISCEGCGVCFHVCPAEAVIMEKSVEGEWYVSESRFGPMVHARLSPGGENSGKLVTQVRQSAKQMAETRNCGLIITDGSPGISCPVIASLTGADMALIVTEPTLSGEHDLERVAQLAKQFGIPTMVCINKRDLNPDQAENMMRRAQANGLEVTAMIDYDSVFTAAQIEGLSVVEFSDNIAATQIKELWRKIVERLELNNSREEFPADQNGKEQQA